MIKKIVTIPNPILKQVSKNIDPAILGSKKIRQLAEDLVHTLYSSKDGIGLAAPQIGESLQMCVIGKDAVKGKQADLVLINPTWQKMSVFKTKDLEGCLSVPGIYGEVKRYKKIKVKTLDFEGKMVEFVAGDFLARVIQHEVDHLNGILFIEKAKNLQENHDL